MKKVVSVILACMMVFSLVACSSEKSSTSNKGTTTQEVEATGTDEAAVDTSNAEYELVIGHIVDEDNTWHKASEKFKEIVEKNSNGRIKVTIYPNSTLGTEVDMLQSMLTGGGCDITFTGESLQTYAEEMGILGMPYAITSEEHLKAVVDGEVGDELKEIMLNSGFRALGYFERGPRYITSNKEIHTPDDLKGFIIRTPQSTMTVAAFEAMGAKPTPMAFSEIFTSLQQGVIDGQENPLAMIKSGALYEVQDYVIETAHLRAWVYITISEQKWQQLPEDLQTVVADAATEMQSYEHELFLKNEEADKAFLEEKGMKFIEVDQNLFKDKAVEGVLSVLTDKQKDLYDKIVAANPAN
ncbi:MAG: DctP family TRAP transporter solute-binding subunit [Velocimicrobium sp.]